MLRVGIPKEIKPLEKRVGLAPSAARLLTQQGIEVLVEMNAGAESGYADQDYERAGAKIVRSAAEVYAQSGLIQKVKEPLAPEFEFFRKGLMIFGFMHLAAPENAPLISALVRSEVTAIGYETLEQNGRFPLLAPMSEIAGGLAAAYAAILKGKNPVDSGLTDELEKTAALYPSFKEIPSPGEVVIFGGGVAGTQALKTVLRLRGSAGVIEKDIQRRKALKEFTEKIYSPNEDLTETLENAEVLIGSVHSRGERAVQVLSPDQLAQISRKKKKIIFDIAIDQGGNFPESRPTSYLKPVYRDSWGNVRFCVPNIPSLCGRGASEALSRVALPYTEKLAKDEKKAFRENPELAAAVNIEKGIIKIPAVTENYRKG